MDHGLINMRDFRLVDEQKITKAADLLMFANN